MIASSTGPEFPPTRWTIVQRLKQGRRDPEGEKALAELCEIYWHPIYAYARRRGLPPEDAEDLTQGFFTRLVQKDLFAKADPNRGRLRSFLLGSFRNFMSEELRLAGRLKRGGGQHLISIESLQAEELQLARQGVDPSLDAESLFDREWFDALIEQALNNLEQEYIRRGKGKVFKWLQEFLAWNKKDGRLAEAATELGMAPGAVRVTVLRMRQRFRELIEAQIADTVQDEAEAAEELAHLRRVFGA